MRLIDTSVRPPEGTWRYKFCRWFCDIWNFCHGVYFDRVDSSGMPVDKPDNKLYDWFYTYWLFPFKQNDCICCNTVRGLIYGAIVGFITGSLL